MSPVASTPAVQENCAGISRMLMNVSSSVHATMQAYTSHRFTTQIVVRRSSKFDSSASIANYSVWHDETLCGIDGPCFSLWRFCPNHRIGEGLARPVHAWLKSQGLEQPEPFTKRSVMITGKYPPRKRHSEAIGSFAELKPPSS